MTTDPSHPAGSALRERMIEDKLPLVLSVEEVARLLEAAPGPRWMIPRPFLARPGPAAKTKLFGLAVKQGPLIDH